MEITQNQRADRYHFSSLPIQPDGFTEVIIRTGVRVTGVVLKEI